MRSSIKVVAFCVAFLLPAAAMADVMLRHVDVFESGAEGYHTIRIPAIAVTGNGTLIAFTEGRLISSADPGAGDPIDIIYKRSTDGGRTWSDLEVMFQGDTSIGGFQATVVVDLEGGRNRLWVFYDIRNATATRPLDKGLVAKFSDDNGLTWSSQINYNYLNPGGTSNFTANIASGVQMLDGRLVIPMKIVFSGQESQPSVIYSDNNGETWQLGGQTPEGANEHQIVELTGGRLLSNARRNGTSANRRQCFSPDGGLTWGGASSSLTVGDDVACGIERYTWAGINGETVNRILFSAPVGGGASVRSNLTLFTSTDEGASYGNDRLAHYGRCAYSDVARSQDGDVCGVLWERGNTSNYKYITYTTFNREFLEPTSSPGQIAYEGFNYAVNSNMGFQIGGSGWNSSWKNQTNLNVEAAADAGIGNKKLTHSEFASTGRNAYFDDGGIMVRGLGVGVDMNANQTRYMSLLISKEDDVSANGGSQEFLDIALRNSSGTSHVQFGVSSNEAFYVSQLGGTVTGGSNAIDNNSAVFLVAKIVTQDSSGGNYDQIFLKAFASGEKVPTDDSQVNWTLNGTTTENSGAFLDRISIVVGTSADWTIDELRIGSSWNSVTFDMPFTQIYDAGTAGNPATAPSIKGQGWTRVNSNGGITVSSVNDDNGFNAKNINDDTSAVGAFTQFHKIFTPSMKFTSIRNGWKFGVHMRVVSGNGDNGPATVIHYDDTARRAYIFMDEDYVTGHITVTLAGGAVVDLGPNDGGYHDYQMRCEPSATGDVQFYFDDQLQAVFGFADSIGGSGIFFGSGSSAGQSSCNFHTVTFETGNCGDFLVSDINRDCYVDMQDMALVALQWLQCTDPQDPINCD